MPRYEVMGEVAKMGRISHVIIQKDEDAAREKFELAHPGHYGPLLVKKLPWSMREKNDR